MRKLDNEDVLSFLALALPLGVRLAADGGAVAAQRLGVLALILLVAYSWSAMFARHGARPVGTGLVAAAMLFVLLPPGVAGWGSAALAISFGIVFGREVFGGAPVLPPALIALAFALFSFPAGGFEAKQVLTGPVDPTLALACLPGAALLVWKRALAWRVAAGAAVGAAGISVLLGHGAWWDHFTAGTFAAGILFLAAVPACSPKRESARWLHGLLAGGLVVMIRLHSPDQADGVVFGILLAGLFAPLLDRAVGWRLRHG